MSANGHPFVSSRKLREADGGDVLEAQVGDDGPWVDASLAPIIGELDELGYETLQSDSGIQADHPGREDYRPTNGYISIVEDDDGRVAAIRQAASQAGLVAGFNAIFGEGRTAFGAEGITVRMPYTNDGTSKNRLRLKANETFEERDGQTIDFYKGGQVDTDTFLEKLRERNEIRRELAEREHGGIFDAPDEQVFSMWQSFVSNLRAETATTLLDNIDVDDLPQAARDVLERAEQELKAAEFRDLLDDNEEAIEDLGLTENALPDREDDDER